AFRAKHAKPMRFVDHQPGVVPALDFHEFWQVGNIAVHAIEALDHDQRALELMAKRGEQRIERVQIVLRERAPLGAGQSSAGKIAVMREVFVDDQILWSNDGSDRGNIGCMAADKYGAIFLTVMLSQCLFERLMARALARDKTARRCREAELVYR